VYDVDQAGCPQVLIRAEDFGFRPLLYVMRTGRDPRALLPEVRAAVREVDTRDTAAAAARGHLAAYFRMAFWSRPP
jgi:hypothetical protein